MSKTTKLLILTALPLVALTWVLTEELLYSQNSLYLNDAWSLPKKELELPTMGTDDFLLTRRPLALNRLDLGAYYGYQEVVYRRPLELRGVRFKFKIGADAYLDFTYGRKTDSYHAVRLSRQALHPSVIYHSRSDGEFLTQQPYLLLDPGPGWHTAEFRGLNETPELWLDGRQIPLPAAAQFSGEGRAGFRAGLNGALIDDVQFDSQNASLPLLDFKNRGNFAPVFAFNLAILVLGSLLLWWFAGRPKQKIFLLQAFILYTVAALSAGLLYFWDFNFYSRVQHADSGITRLLYKTGPMPLGLERMRFAFFAGWFGLTGGETVSAQGLVRRGYTGRRITKGPIYCQGETAPCTLTPPKIFPPERRVLFIGTSQTVGAGAMKLEDSLFVRLHRRLSRARGSAPLQSINASYSGAGAEFLFHRYQELLPVLKPGLLVINLSNNDSDTGAFAYWMRQFLRLSRDSKIPTVLIEEANSNEHQLDFLLGNHQTLRRLGREFGVPVLPLNTYLSAPATEAQGNLWWDVVHLSSFGQKLAANWLAERLLPLLPK